MVREALTADALDALEPREAAAYFIARRSEGLTPSEEQLLSDWLAKNEAHRRLLDSADQAWRSFADAEDDEILTAMRAHALAPPQRGRWRPVAVGAAAVLAVACAALFVLVPNLNPWTPSPTAAIQYASARGVQEIQFPDGGGMTLDASSAASAQFSAHGRDVALERGRAFFQVARDPSRPFTVNVADRRVVAVGTKFDVNLAANVLRVTLIEGRITVGGLDPAQPPITLAPGQQYVERLGEPPTIRNLARPDYVTSWRSGLVSFDGETLAEAAAMLNRYAQEQIVINDPDVARLLAGGGIRAGDAEASAQNLAEMHRLRTLRRANEIELVRP